MKIYTRSHNMSFIHVHILQRTKGIHVNGYRLLAIRALNNLSKLKNAQFLPYICKQ